MSEYKSNKAVPCRATSMQAP